MDWSMILNNGAYLGVGAVLGYALARIQSIDKHVTNLENEVHKEESTSGED